MRRILLALANEASFLYADKGYRITDSNYDPSFGGVGEITLSGENLDLRFWLDRDRLFLDFRARRANKPVGEWFSTGIIRQKLTGEIDNDLINSDNLDFIRDYIDKISDIFKSESLSVLTKELKSLEKERAERMFGS